MNAPNPNGERGDMDALRRAQRAHEPSMEEILASIRAIIADERDSEPAKVAAPVKPVPAPKPASPPVGPQIVYSNDSPPVLRAAPEPDPAPPVVAAAPALEPMTPKVVWRQPEPERDPEADFEPEPEPVLLAAPEPEPQPARFETAPEAPLLSEENDRAITASFHALSASVALQNTDLVEKLTREMLRPMIKGWLDDHLPNLVERLVRAEIQRVARGGR